MDKLLPCPFCGCEKIEFKQSSRDGFTITCKGCSVKRKQKAWRQSLEWLEEKMITHWNTRHVPKGYVVVPEEPTEAMLLQGECARQEHESYNTMACMRVGYKAMIANTGEQDAAK